MLQAAILEWQVIAASFVPNQILSVQMSKTSVAHASGVIFTFADCALLP